MITKRRTRNRAAAVPALHPREAFMTLDGHSLLAGLLIGLMAAVAAGCGDASRAAAPPPLPVVKVEPVAERDVPITFEYVGTLVGYINAQIRARVSGHLVSQNYKEGALVKSGDLLFQVDPRPFQTAADQADARLQLAESQLSQAKAQVSASQAQVEQALATVVQAEARLNLGYTRVSSPVAGVAGFRVANIGDFVGPSDAAPLTTVSQVDPIYAEFPISEQRALAVFRRWDADPRAPRDIELELVLADGSVYPTRGRAAALDRQVDVTTGTVLARGAFSNPGNVLRPGQYAKVRAVVETRKGALLVPQRAVHDVQGTQQVAVVKADGTVDVRTVKVDARVGPLWVIADGLKLGERVVVEVGDRVRQGQKVRLAASAPADPAAPK